MAVLADGLDGKIKTVIPYLLFPSDPASAAMHCAPAGHAPRSVSAPMKSRAPAAAEATAASEITGIAHRSGGRVGDGFAYFHLYSQVYRSPGRKPKL